MKHLLPLLAFLTLSPLALTAQEGLAERERLAATFEEKVSTIATHALGASEQALLPGVGLAEGISEVTGVAISPLLGISAVGAWKYWHTAEKARASLPWYCQPWAWGTGLSIIALCFFKDLFGSAVPGILKKPLDWMELFENKASALVASTAFVPLVALAMSEYQRIQPEQAGVALAGSGLAAAPLAAVIQSSLQSPWVTIPLTLALFGIVWLTSHTVHVMIALSPFSLLDSVLKLSKLAVLGVLTACGAMIHTISPVPALVVCGIIAVISALLARWSFRLLVFGYSMVGDLLLRRKAAADEMREEGMHAFLARQLGGIPARSRGRIVVEGDGRVFFARRPFLILPEKRVPLPEGTLVVGKGMLHPSMLHRSAAGEAPRRLCYLLPRYRGIEESLAARLGGAEIQDSALVRGFKAMRQWLSDLVRLPGESTAA